MGMTVASAQPVFDTTPEICYKDGKAVRVTTYCVVNGWTRSEHSVRITCEGNYLDSCFDEHHGIGWNDQPVELSRLETLDAANPHCVPILPILGKSRTEVESLLTERGLRARHI